MPVGGRRHPDFRSARAAADIEPAEVMDLRLLAPLLILAVAACPRSPEPPPDLPEEEPPPLAPGWERPVLEFEEMPPTGHAGMYAIVTDRVGPLYADMPAELDALRGLFSDFDVRVATERIERERRQEVFAIYEMGTELLVVEPTAASGRGDDAAIDRVRVQSSLFRTPRGLGCGDSFERVERAYGPLTCRSGARPATGERIAVCRGSGEAGALQWIFDAPAEGEPDASWGAAESAERLAGAPVREVWWRPGGR